MEAWEMNWSHSSLLLLFLLLLWGFPGGHTVVPPPLGPTDSTWELTLDEDFLGTSLNRSLWVPQQTATSGFTSGTANFTACYVDTPQNIAIGNGFLNLTLRKESANISCGNTNSNFSTPFTSASISTYYKWSQTYGFFEVRALLPNVTVYGVQETFWLWPVDSVKFGPWPYSGEIDFAEFYSRYSDLVVPYLHYVPASIDLSVTAYNCTLNLTDFNVYGVDWSNESITIYLNGKVCLKDVWNPAAPLVFPEPFNQPFFPALTQAIGTTGNEYQPGVTPLPATTMVDYIRAWQRASTSSSPESTSPSPSPLPSSSSSSSPASLSSSPPSSPPPTTSPPPTPDVPSQGRIVSHSLIFAFSLLLLLTSCNYFM